MQFIRCDFCEKNIGEQPFYSVAIEQCDRDIEELVFFGGDFCSFDCLYQSIAHHQAFIILHKEKDNESRT